MTADHQGIVRMESQEKKSAIADNLRKQIKSVSELSDILQREYAALREMKFTEVEIISGDKSRILKHLETMEQALKDLLDPSHQTGSALNLRESLHALDPSDRHDLKKLESQFRTLVSQCQHQNQVNGAVITVCHQFTEKALAVLHGRSAATKTDVVYGRNGQTESEVRSQTLTKA